ncbi:hypothetical protein E4U41_006013 [Claviceps citrina]|nr:hypothetical protein E4U41_006013 [Claviceps citrina]
MEMAKQMPDLSTASSKTVEHVQGRLDAGAKYTAEPRARCRSEADNHDLLCARSLLLWFMASTGTGIAVAIILVITWAAQPKAMRSTLSHNFISQPVTTDAPTPEIFVQEYSRSVMPVPVHSHNDYERPRPLYSALAAGCTGVEADVWLSRDRANLLVGHHASRLSGKRTLQSLYLDPIKQILDQLNPANASGPDDVPHGVYQSSPESSLILLIDVKGNASEIWPLVDKQLQPLRERGYLSRLEHNSSSTAASRPVFKRGPITVVGSGNLGTSNIPGTGCDALGRYSDSFLDAPLASLTDASNFGTLPSCQAESLLGLPLAKFQTASAPFLHTVASFLNPLSSSQRGMIRASLQAAASKNLTSRYWATPTWPVSRRDHIWQVLVEEGIGLLNADDIESATGLEWNRAYGAELVWMGVSSAYEQISFHLGGLQAQVLKSNCEGCGQPKESINTRGTRIE